MRLLLLLALAAGPSLAAAQVEIGAAAGPESLPFGESKPKGASLFVEPLALAASLAFDATAWTRIGVSTSPARDLTRLLGKGFYRLELLQVLLMAHKSGTALQALAAEREKGERLRDMAGRLRLDYDALYDESLAFKRDVEGRLLPAVMTVSVSTVAPRLLPAGRARRRRGAGSPRKRLGPGAPTPQR